MKHNNYKVDLYFDIQTKVFKTIEVSPMDYISYENEQDIREDFYRKNFPNIPGDFSCNYSEIDIPSVFWTEWHKLKENNL